MNLDRAIITRIVAEAVAEDLAWGDITTDSLIPRDERSVGRLVAHEEGVLAGIEVAECAFNIVDPDVDMNIALQDGERLSKGTLLAEVSGPTASILKAERTALNFLQRLSGIATSASRFVTAIAGTHARIVDTRKTTPGLRVLEKYAVRVGGAANHRFCLADGVMIKDNHLASLRRRGVDMRHAIELARARVPHTMKIEVEVESLDEVKEAVAAGADVIMLDNMSPSLLRDAVRIVGGHAIMEASGGIELENVRAVAESGVDLISSGAITHSAKALDISLDLYVEIEPLDTKVKKLWRTASGSADRNEYLARRKRGAL